MENLGKISNIRGTPSRKDIFPRTENKNFFILNLKLIYNILLTIILNSKWKFNLKIE